MVSPGTTPDAISALEGGHTHKIVAHLHTAQQRDLRKDTGHGYRSTRLIAEAIGLTKIECRAILEQLATAGDIRREEFSNGLYWRSITPLPWEPGGTMEQAQARERELWAGDLNLIVQAVWMERGQTLSRDVKAYPEGLRQRAEDHVALENHQSQSRREDDRWNNRHLRDGYTPPPSYRLVSISKATGQ